MKTAAYNFFTVIAGTITLMCGAFLINRFQPELLNIGNVLGQATIDPLEGAYSTLIFQDKTYQLSRSEIQAGAHEVLAKLELLNANQPIPQITDGQIKFCDQRNFDFSIDKNRLIELVETGFKQNRQIEVKVEDIYSKDDDAIIVTTCIQHNALLAQIEQKIWDQVNVNLNLGSFVSPQVDTGLTIDNVGLDNSLILAATKSNIQADSGKFEIHNDKIFLFEPYKLGTLLNNQVSRANIIKALETRQVDLAQLQFDKQKPGVLLLGLPVYDFTQLISEGKTRIDTGRGVHPFGQYGVEEMHNKIIMPGKEFSFNRAIQPQPNGTTITGRPIRPGICNATTTLYRAALEAGLEVTQRKSHGFYVKSYDWGGYPLNIMEATYWPNKVDIRFVNDFKYPILMRSEIRNTGDWQYHTIRMYTSADVQKREVIFKNWKTWRAWSSTIFSGSVERVVKESGKVIRKETIVSEYY